MAAICSNSIRKNGAGCDHRTVTVSLDGESIVVHTTEAELDEMPWGEAEKRKFLVLCLKRQRIAGLAVDNLTGRCVSGDEATNLKQYLLCNGSVTKTNIGTTYVNVSVGANGERTLVEFTGCTQLRLVLHANFIGTGPWQFRIVRDSDSVVLYESASLTQTGERELDTGFVALSAQAAGLIYVRLQGKSAVGADDPVVRKAVLMVQ